MHCVNHRYIRKTHNGLEPSGYTEEGQTKNKVEKNKRMGTADVWKYRERCKRTKLG